MMYRFYKWLYRKSRDALESSNHANIKEMWSGTEKQWNSKLSSPSSMHDLIGNNGINFIVYQATGGYVVETRFYDKKTDHSTNMLHIVDEKSDLGTEIGKIITLQMLRM